MRSSHDKWMIGRGVKGRILAQSIARNHSGVRIPAYSAKQGFSGRCENQ